MSDAQRTSPLSISSAEDSPAKICPSPDTERDLQALDPDSGTKCSESSPRGDLATSLSKTSRTVEADGSLTSETISRLSVIEPVPTSLLRPTSVRRMSAVGASLLPTPTASRYGSGQNGNPGDGREVYKGAKKPSLWTQARRGILPGHPPGNLSPTYLEWMMGFPMGWTESGR